MPWHDTYPKKRRNSAGRMVTVYRGRYRDSAGKLQSVKNADGSTALYFRKNQALAAAQRAETIARAQAPTAVSPDGTITWAEWWARIGGNRHAFGNADKTEKIDVRNWIAPTFGHERLNRISRTMVKKWIKDVLIPAGLSPDHIQKIYYLFKWTFNEALEADPPVLQASPCGKDMGLPAVDKDKPQALITFKDVEQYEELGFRPDLLRVLKFGLETAMRPGEILGMHENQVVWEQGWTKASNTMVPKPRTIKGFTKTGTKRDVPLTREAMVILHEACDGRDMTVGCGVPHLDGKPCTSEIVFRSKFGKPIMPRTVTEELGKFQKEHNLPHKTIYGGRRGGITEGINNGMSVEEMSKIVGHSGTNATKQTMAYYNLTPETRDRLQAARDKATGTPATLTVVANRPGSNDHETLGADFGADHASRMAEDVAKPVDQLTG